MGREKEANIPSRIERPSRARSMDHHHSFQTHIHFIQLLQGVDLFDGVHLLLADEVGDGRHRPLAPILPLHHHSITEQLQCRVL